MKITGNRVLSGNYAEVWIDGDLIAECNGITAKITVGRSDVQMGIDLDSKITSLRGEGTMTTWHVYTSRWRSVVQGMKSGHDPRVQIIAKLSDPDAVGGQTERWAFNNAYFTVCPCSTGRTARHPSRRYPLGSRSADMENLDAVEQA